MPKRSIWLSYDLGLQGDYASLYQWLDAHGAKECGDSMALVNVDYADSLKDDLKEELVRSIDIDKKNTDLYRLSRRGYRQEQRCFLVWRQTRGALDGILLGRGRGC